MSGILLLLLVCSETPEIAPNTSQVGQDKSTITESKIVFDEPPLGQLRKNWVPKHCQWSLTINPDDAEFSGDVNIDVKINKARDHFYLHGNLLKVTDVAYD